MNIQEMHIGCRLGVDQIASQRGDNFLPEEIDYYLNQSIRNFVDQWRPKIQVTKGSLQQQADVVGREAIENVRTLIQEESFDTFRIVENHPTAKTIPLDSLNHTYDHFISGRINTEHGWKNAVFMDPKDFALHSQTYSNRPFFRELPLMVNKDSIYVMGDSTDSIESASIMYMKVPDTVRLNGVDSNNDGNIDLPPTDCDLPTHTHGDIVDLAVNNMLRKLGAAIPNEGE